MVLPLLKNGNNNQVGSLKKWDYVVNYFYIIAWARSDDVKHTYFYATLDWRARGTYYNPDGSEDPLYGQVSIRKMSEEWSLTGFLEVRKKNPVRYTNDYKIYPSTDKTTLSWTSYNPTFGTLNGTYEIVGESIISLYQSEDGVYSGTEVLTWKDDFTYYNVGVAFCNGKKMSSWTATLKGRKTKK